MNNVIIGSARIDERGKISGGAAGDQKQTGAGDDYKGEVSIQSFYVHNKGWYVLRPKNASIAEKMAKNMVAACNNPNIGYDQGQRNGIIANGVNTKVKTECDCSSLVRECIREASGRDIADFNTATEALVLERSGLFYNRQAYSGDITLFTGDVLVTKTKGHTAIVTNGSARITPTALTDEGTMKSIEKIVDEVIAGKWGVGDERRARLAAAGYKYMDIQAAVNAKSDDKTIQKIAKEVIAGKWGNGDERKAKLKAYGYDPVEIQKMINKLLK